MSAFESITIREVEADDLDTFYRQQLDPEANRMAAFVGKDRTNRGVFDAHWAKILATPENITRTIEADGEIVGHIACYPDEGHLEVTYWIGKEYWGRSAATGALELMLALVTERPLFARAAADNAGSRRVLEKCGFQVIGTDKGFAYGRGAETEEVILRLGE